MYQGIIFSSVLIFCLIALLVFKGKLSNKFSIFLKTITIIFCVVGFFRFMLSDSFIWVIKDGYYGDVHYNKTDVWQSILRWGYYLNYAVLPMAVFFKGRLFKNIAIYFCLPFSLLSSVFFNDFMVYFLSAEGRGLALVPGFRYFYFILELVLAISIPIMLMIKYNHHFNVKDKNEWKNYLIALPLIIIQMIPVYVPQSLFGYTSFSAKAFSVVNIIWIAIMLLEIFGLYYYFRFKNYECRFSLCVFLSLVLFFHYNSLYLMGFSIPRLPIQLCNLGAYFFIIAVPLKIRPLFNFAFLANIIGASIAIIAPDTSGGAFGFWNVHFMLEHMLVLIVPALCMALRIFPRLKADSLKHFAIGFTCYFMFCLISGTLLNGYADKTGFTVNYFYIFNLSKAFDYFPFLRFTENIHWVFGRFQLYPLFQLIIYVGFQCICLLFYWILQKLYDITDDHLQLRRSRIELYEKVTGKKSKAPLEFVE